MNKNDFKKNDIEYHKNTAHYYDEQITKTHRIYHSYSLYPFLEDIPRAGKEMRILDMGCGTGVVTLALAERGFKVVGLDLHKR